MGLHLRDVGTPSLPWVDLLTVVHHLPPSSAVGRELNTQAEEEPGDKEWDLTTQLLASQLDALNQIIWRLSNGKKKDQPKPIPRPGARPERFGHASMSLNEAKNFIERRRQGL